MNLLTKTGLITATSLGLIACGGANNGSNTPSNGTTAKAKTPVAAPAPATNTYSPRSVLNLPLIMAASLGYVSKGNLNPDRSGSYESKFVFDNYENNGIVVNGNGALSANFKITNTDTITGSVQYDFDLKADDLNDSFGPRQAKDQRFCKLSGNSVNDYTATCSAGTAINPSDKQEYKLVGLKYAVDYKAQTIGFNGTFKNIPGGDVEISGKDLIACDGNDNGFFQSGTVTIKRDSAQQDTTTLSFSSCKSFTATYKEGNTVLYTMSAANSK